MGIIKDLERVLALQNLGALGRVFKNAATDEMNPRFLKTRLKLFI